MTTVAAGTALNVTLEIGKTLIVSTGGDAYVDVVSGPTGAGYKATRVTQSVGEVGPFGVVAQLRVRATEGDAEATAQSAAGVVQTIYSVDPALDNDGRPDGTVWIQTSGNNKTSVKTNGGYGPQGTIMQTTNIPAGTDTILGKSAYPTMSFTCSGATSLTFGYIDPLIGGFREYVDGTITGDGVIIINCGVGTGVAVRVTGGPCVITSGEG